jgi:hypothetical protein
LSRASDDLAAIVAADVARDLGISVEHAQRMLLGHEGQRPLWGPTADDASGCRSRVLLDLVAK